MQIYTSLIIPEHQWDGHMEPKYFRCKNEAGLDELGLHWRYNDFKQSMVIVESIATSKEAALYILTLYWSETYVHNCNFFQRSYHSHN